MTDRPSQKPPARRMLSRMTLARRIMLVFWTLNLAAGLALLAYALR